MNENVTANAIGLDNEFNDVMIESKRDILKLTVDDYYAIPEGEQSFLRLKSTQTDNIKSIGELKKRIFEYIHMSSLEMYPLKLGTINRRFSKVAKRLGTSTHDITQQLIISGHIKSLDWGGITALFSAPVRAGMIASNEEDGIDPRETLERILGNAR